MKPRPYVGVTGPSSVEEVKQIVEAFKEAEYSMDGPHIPMLGFLVSHKTFNKKPTDNRRYPKIEDLRPMLEATNGQVLTMIHYNSRESYLEDQLRALLKLDDIYKKGLCRALQLNITMPILHSSLKYPEAFPELQIVFQANKNVLTEEVGSNNKYRVELSPKEVVDKIKEYLGIIDHVLIDPSGGKGEEFDLKKAATIFKDAKWQLPGVTIGFAGGLNGENVEARVNELVSKLNTRDFSIDAEGCLRDKVTEKYGDDLLNMEKVRKYLQAAAKVLP